MGALKLTYNVENPYPMRVIWNSQENKNLVQEYPLVDPLTAKYPHYSPYHFAGNTPIVAIDVDGQEDLWIHFRENDDGTYTKVNEQYDVDANTRDALSKAMGGAEIPNTGVVYTVEHIDGTKQVIKSSETVVITPTQTFGEKIEQKLGDADRLLNSRKGDEGFKQVGKDLKKGSNYVKAAGAVVVVVGAVTGQPEIVAAGVETYEAGSTIGNAGSTVNIISDLHEGKNQEAVGEALGVVAGSVSGKAINGAKGVSDVNKFVTKATIDAAIDKSVDNTAAPDKKK